MLKRIIVIIILSVFFTPFQALASQFHDIQGHWAHEEINLVYQKGLMKGTGLNSFHPNQDITRAELAVCLVKAFELNIDSTKFFKAPEPRDLFDDVQAGQWYADAAMIAGYNNIFSISDRMFRPNEKISRIEAAISIDEAFRAKNMDVVTTQIWPNYIDIGNDDYIGVVNFMYNSGIMKGRSVNRFAPDENLTRGELAVVLNRITTITEKYQL